MENNKKKIPYADPETIKESVSEAVIKVSKQDDDVIEIKKKTSEELEKIELVVKLSNKYKFEGDTIEQIDLNGLKDLTTLDVNAAEKLYFQGGNFAPVSELTAAYCIILAAQGCNYPLELLQGLKANDTTKIKTTVSTFLLS